MQTRCMEDPLVRSWDERSATTTQAMLFKKIWTSRQTRNPISDSKKRKPLHPVHRAHCHRQAASVAQALTSQFFGKTKEEKKWLSEFPKSKRHERKELDAGDSRAQDKRSQAKKEHKITTPFRPVQNRKTLDWHFFDLALWGIRKTF